MTEKSSKLVDSLSELNDLEFEIVFVDSVYKKLKSVYSTDSKSPTLLFIYYSVLETLKNYKLLAKEGNRDIPHKDIIDLIISKGDSYLSYVAEDESKQSYIQKSLSDSYDLTKLLLLNLKSELTELPKYADLKSKMKLFV
jgi:hypothetical protein